MKKAYIISTGTELLLGTTVDTNSVYLSQQLCNLGLRIVGKSTVGDSHEQMSRAFAVGLESADMVIASGGLGPTFDDLTKKVACEMMDCELLLREEEASRLRAFFARRQREMPEINLKQAMFPAEATVLNNERGSAPGMYLNKEDKIIVLLPGPPSEMRPMFQNTVIPLLQKVYAEQLKRVFHRTIKVLGPSESKVEEMLGNLMENTMGCSLALLASDGEIQIKVTAEGEESQDSEKILNRFSEQIVERMGKYVFGFNEDTLVSRVADLLQQKKQKLALAESCTGGLLSKMITDLPGSSSFYWGGANVYSNESKSRLVGVSEDTLINYGAVSAQTAEELAVGIKNRAGAEYGLSITGIAGPGGGSEEKPVGLVYIGLASEKECRVKELRFVGPREAIRMLAARSALDFLRRELQSQ